MTKSTGPKVLLVDIETAPIIGYVWALWDQNVGLNQIKSDWHILSWSAKWLEGADGRIYGPHGKIMYSDQRNAKNIENDKSLLQGIWDLLDSADIVIWQNGRNFDHKKLNARFILNGMQPPSSYKQIDTLEIAKKYFGFTSNKLEYMSDKLCTKYKKLTHKKFPGFEMWKECLAGNLDAWRSMEKYNKYDVLSLEELFTKLAPWDNAVNFNLWSDSTKPTCRCGSTTFQRRGFTFTAVGKFQKFRCMRCGSETRGRDNLMPTAKKKTLRVSTTR